MSFFSGLLSPDQLTGLDAVFLYMESKRTPMHVGGLYIYDPSTRDKGSISFEEVTRYVGARTHLAKPFRKKLSQVTLDLDYPYWTDDEAFRVEHHMRSYQLERPGGWHQLMELAQELFAEPIDLSKPLWQFNYISGLDTIDGVPKGSFAILSKAHHSAIDGASGVDIDKATHSISAGEQAPPPAPEWKPETPPGLGAKLMRAQINALNQPLKSLQTTQALAPGAAKLLASLVAGNQKLPPARAPKTKFNTNVSARRSIGAACLPMADIKTIRKALGEVTVNDVVLAIVGGALREYIDSEGTLPKSPMLAMAPISVRTDRSAGSTGNDVANMTVSLGTHIQNPVNRLWHIHEVSKDAKAVTAMIGAKAMSEASKNSPPWLSNLSVGLTARFGLTPLTRPATNTTVTNVPGPRVPLYFSGCRLVRQHNLAPLMHGMGLVHTVYSYCGELTVTFNACGEMLPNPTFYEDCIQRAAQALLAAATGREAEPSSATRQNDPITEFNDLTSIRGIGAVQAGRLNILGVRSLQQLAALPSIEADHLAKRLNGRVDVEDWVRQAQQQIKSNRPAETA